VRRLGSKQKALVALQHSILVSAWHLLSANTDYHDLGSDYFLRREPERERRRAIAALNKLGYTVTLNPIEATPKAA
jgi:transposase